MNECLLNRRYYIKSNRSTRCITLKQEGSQKINTWRLEQKGQNYAERLLPIVRASHERARCWKCLYKATDVWEHSYTRLLATTTQAGQKANFIHHRRISGLKANTFSLWNLRHSTTTTQASRQPWSQPFVSVFIRVTKHTTYAW